MTTFKDAIEQDVTNVFLNPDEFAKTYNLNGNDVCCMVDTDLVSGIAQTLENPAFGIFHNAVTIYVKTADMERKPVEGELLYLDDKMFYVRKVNIETGMYVIVVEANEQ